MPRATRGSTKSVKEDVKTYPYPKSAPKKQGRPKNSKVESEPVPTETETETEVVPKKASEPKSASKSKSTTTSKSQTGKDSHLYTDDNPATTLHSTGFKDAAIAKHTIDLVAKRSLLYQFQTINTMYHRAKHHPHSSMNNDMQAAMDLFRTWLDETYPTARAAQVEFKPNLRRDVVEKYLPALRSQEIDTKWAEMYIELPKGKRLANVLMDDEKPGEADMARHRQDGLVSLMQSESWSDGSIPAPCDEVLWEGDGVSMWHLKCMALGWSPVKPDELLKKVESGGRLR